MLKNKLSLLLAGATALLGVVAGTAFVASAQSAPTSTNAPAAVTSSAAANSTVDTPETANDPADTDTGTEKHGHMPLGNDGVVSSISGTTIIVSEESDEGGATYTIDASKATVTNN